MSRKTAWLERRPNGYAIRHPHPTERDADGSPKLKLTMIDRDGIPGERVKSRAEATPYLHAWLARNAHLIASPTARYPLTRIAEEWHKLHPTHASRDEYLLAVQRIATPKDKGGMGITYADEMTALVVEQWKVAHNHRGCDRPLAYLRAVLNWGARAELCPKPSISVDATIAAPQTQQRNPDTMTHEQWRESMKVAARWGQLALAHCLSTYGWRAVTACRATVGMVDLERRWIGPLAVKHTRKNKKPKVHEHELFPDTIELLRPLVAGRDPKEPLFLRWDGQPWRIHKGRALQFVAWYRNHVQHLAPNIGATYAWKRFAIARMDRGESPWAKHLRNKVKQRFTGHATEQILTRYSSTNDEEVAEAMGDPLYVVPDADGQADESVASISAGGVAVVSGSNGTPASDTECNDDQAKVIQFPVNRTQKQQ